MMPFITYREEQGGELKYFILQKAHPHFLGVVVYAPIENSIMNAIPISGHNLWVAFAGVLQGNFLPAYKNIEEEIKSTYTLMADWFYKNRIEPEPSRYKKWKIK